MYSRQPKKVLKAKKAKRVSVILMNPQNGEIYALVSLPEYDLNEPFALIEAYREPKERLRMIS
ncbi:MAG: hypothetical protein ACLRYY_10265 [Anaerobutyricum soehngenii]